MTVTRGPRRRVCLALSPILVLGIAQPVSGEQHGASAEAVPTDARIERLREAIERERKALERERETRRSMEEELGRMRDELESTREALDRLESEADPGAGSGN